MYSDDTHQTPAYILPKLVLEAAPQYLLGFPLVIAVTYENRTPDEEYRTLPNLGLLWSMGSLGVILKPVDGGKLIELAPGRPRPRERGVALGPNDQRRMLLDLSNLDLTIVPGAYLLTLTLRAVGQQTSSNSVAVEFLRPDPEDARVAEQLRRTGNPPLQRDGWAEFLRDNRTTVEPPPALSSAARQQLALHLFLHRSFYGPEPVAQLDATPLGRIKEPHLAAEVIALRYEISEARGAADAKDLRKALLSRWPAMLYRIEPGAGFLAEGRTFYGADNRFINPSDPIPYKRQR